MPARIAEKTALLMRAKRKISRSGLDALLVNDETDIFYLTGYACSGAMLLIPKKGRAVYFVDSMNESLARKMLKGLDLQGIIPGPVPVELKTFVREKKVKKLGFNEKKLSVYEFDRLVSASRGLKWRPSSAVLRDMRRKKESREIKTLKKAAKETIKIWRQVRKNIKTGMSEREIAAMIDVCVRSRGYENSFPTIAAAGKNTAYPHAIPGIKRLERGEHLLVDFGIRFQGYCSDLTRTWDNGRIDRQIRHLRKCVRKAHDLAIKKLKPGIMIGSLVKEVNLYIKNNNLGGYIRHGLGHGIGLDIHEGPFLREASRERLQEGMIVTVEPGLYNPGVGGVREEDMVLITKKGCEVLTR